MLHPSRSVEFVRFEHERLASFDCAFSCFGTVAALDADELPVDLLKFLSFEFGNDVERAQLGNAVFEDCATPKNVLGEQSVLSLGGILRIAATVAVCSGVANEEVLVRDLLADFDEDVVEVIGGGGREGSLINEVLLVAPCSTEAIQKLLSTVTVNEAVSQIIEAQSLRSITAVCDVAGSFVDEELRIIG